MFTHKPVGFLCDAYVHPEHTPELWAAIWTEAKKQPWWSDDVGYVGNMDGWFYFQKPGLTHYARCRVEIPEGTFVMPF